MDMLSNMSTNSTQGNNVHQNVSNSTSLNAAEDFGTLHYGRHEFITTRPEIAIPVVIILSVASLVGIVGNTITLLVITNRKNYKNVENIFMVNLVISDFYVILVADPMSITAKIEGEDFFDQIPGLCQTVASICTVSCVTSLMTIGLLSINRYFYICAHEKYAHIFTKCNCICMCISMYLIGGLLILLNAADIGDHGFDKKSLECMWDRMATYPYTVVFSVTLVWIPAIIIGACYFRIYLYVRAHGKRMRGANNAIPSKSFQLAKTLFTMYVVFITCWAPYAILIVADVHNEFAMEIHLYISMFAHMHPSFSCFVYYLTNKKFAAGFKQLFSRCKVRRTDLAVRPNLFVNNNSRRYKPTTASSELQLATIIPPDNVVNKEQNSETSSSW